METHHQHEVDHAPTHGHGQGHGGHQHGDESSLAELLDLDAEVLAGYLAELTGWLAELTATAPPVRILDLGAGTGTGTIALLQQFDRAEVTALDLSHTMLQRLRDKAQQRGLTGRVHPVPADLDQDWPALEPVDLVWASASLHHMSDPGLALERVRAALRPGGLLAAIEMDSFPQFLPADVGHGRPGLEARAHAVTAARRTLDMPHLGDDWGPRLVGAGFTIEAERRFDIDLRAPLPAMVNTYAELSLRRIRPGLEGGLDADDLETFDLLLDGDGPLAIRNRRDLGVRVGRTVWIGRRPV